MNRGTWSVINMKTVDVLEPSEEIQEKSLVAGNLNGNVVLLSYQADTRMRFALYIPHGILSHLDKSEHTGFKTSWDT